MQVTTQELEDGWTQYGGGFGTKWQPADNKKHPREIHGIVTSKNILPAKPPKFTKEGGYVEIATEGGESWSVSKTSAIAGWFDAVRIGDEVRLRFTGLIKIKGQKNPMIGIQALIKSEKKAKRR